MIYLHDILHALTGQKVAPQETSICGAVIDSRLAEQNSLFIALPGENVDGHDYVRAAFTNGATLAFVDREMPEGMRVLDLRPDYFNPAGQIPELPFCLRIEDSLTALQTLAAYWRRQHTLRVIGSQAASARRPPKS